MVLARVPTTLGSPQRQITTKTSFAWTITTYIVESVYYDTWTYDFWWCTHITSLLTKGWCSEPYPVTTSWLLWPGVKGYIPRSFARFARGHLRVETLSELYLRWQRAVL